MPSFRVRSIPSVLQFIAPFEVQLEFAFVLSDLDPVDIQINEFGISSLISLKLRTMVAL